jgi:hypothetical protein
MRVNNSLHERNGITGKTVLNLFLSIVFLIVTAIVTGVILRVIDFYYPAPPVLPDVAHDFIPYIPAVNLADLIILVSAVSELILVVYRFKLRSLIVFRRIIMSYSITLIIRNLVIAFTLFPEPNVACPKDYSKTLDVSFTSVLKVIFSPKTCGDLVFSGRAVALIFPSVTHHHYFGNWMTYVFWFGTILGSILLLASRNNYSVDVMISFYFTPAIFWAYHACAEHKKIFADYWPIFKFFFGKMEWCDPLSMS